MVGLANALAESEHTGLLAEVLEELCDLVSIHAWSRDLDGTRPVEVVVAQVEGELLKDSLFNRGVVVGDEVVSG